MLSYAGASRAHCDTLDGPVVAAARQSLETGRLGAVLAWVRPGDEQLIRTAHASAVAARGPGGAAREAADRTFFETLVRVHRSGEGASFTGLKPAGTDLGPALVAADRAIDVGSVEEAERLLVEAVRDGLHQRFAALRARQPPGEDVAAGRAWVAAYVDYVHFVERVHAAAAATGAGHEHAAANNPHGPSGAGDAQEPTAGDAHHEHPHES